MDGAELGRRVAEREWYHTMDLAGGVVTPGWFDTRDLAARLPMPASLAGQRCLDVGTFDGFWAFEMERRGAAEVVAVDVLDPRAWDWPADASAEAVTALARRKGQGEGFTIAAQALGSAVRRVERSVYDLGPKELGHFDFVYVGSLLLHLRDPVGALARARSLCRGQLLVVDAIDLLLGLARRPLASLDGRGRPWWWRPNAAGLARMVEAAGFEMTEPLRRVFVPPGPGQPGRRLRLGALRRRAGWEELVAARWGDPHGVVLARPTPGRGAPGWVAPGRAW